MPEWLQVIILGVVEGVTEFLPISSTGHLIVAAELVRLDESLRGTFEIVIQLGAVLAVLAYYWRDLLQQAKSITQEPAVRRLWLGVLVAFIPAAVVGLAFDDQIDALLFNPLTVAVSLIVGGIIFLAVEWGGLTRRSVSATRLQQVSLMQALIIGLVQTLALVPGVSRSGASIIGGLLTGLDRRTATEFSFYLAIPTLGLATLYVLLRDFEQLSAANLGSLVLGTAISGVVAWLSIRWLLNFVSKNSFIAFGYYRIVAGALILLLLWQGWL